MWQIAYLWSMIPMSVIIWITNIILLVGISATVAGFFIKFIPFVNRYRLPTQIIGIMLLSIGLFLKGGQYTEQLWRNRVAELEAKVAKAEAESKVANSKLSSAIKDKNKTIKEVQVVIQERIKNVEQKIDAECKIDREALEILNDAAKNSKGKK